jgi:hypothetical protein
MLQLQTLPRQPVTVRYASQVNGRFHKSQSQYVDIATRLAEAIKHAGWRAGTVAQAAKEFAVRNKGIQSKKNIKLCSAQIAKMSQIVIDVTLQRELSIQHLVSILTKFKQILVMPICVYEDPAAPGKYVCWDGQHTIVMLYIIYAQILGEDVSDVDVPIVVYPSTMKAEMRECFIMLNGDAKQPLDPIDIFYQKIYGVRTDGSTNADWILAEAKQQALESNDMFATNEKFGDEKQPGALTVLTELANDDYGLEVTQAFCKYFKSVCDSNRPVRPKESWMLYQYFDLCFGAGITVDDAYISRVAQALQVVDNGDFNASEFFNAAKSSYQRWFLHNKPNPDGTLWGITYPEKRLGMTFLIRQIEKAGVQVPTYTQPLWVVPAKDLY